MRELLIFNLSGMRYGVWESDVRSVRDASTIHRLPLSPACIAGMSILDDRSVTIADLSVCIGLPPITREQKAHLLVMSEEDRSIGFVVEGDIEHAAIPPDAVFPMPEYLKTPEVETCVLRGQEPIPVINISALYDQIRKTDHEPSVAEFHVSSTRRHDLASVKRVRIFESGEELFSAPADIFDDGSERPAGISRLALTPQYVKGIAFHRGNILPLIHLARKMDLPEEGSGKRMLAADLSGARFGILVDTDEGALSGNEFALKRLPPLVESGWMRAAVLRGGEILPLIDLAQLLSVRPGSKDEKPLSERYVPDSRFSSSFGREEVEVVEFLLLGARHALPKAEVEDTLKFRPYRHVPNVQLIVAGVAEHNGELLPVLDLAMCFGRRSLVTPEWSMILVKNGDFRALVITEAAFGARRLPQEMHRAVPIVLPHRIVYGCYPDAATVKLILNVEALAVHFDKVLVKELIAAISKEMRQAPAEIVPSLLELVESKELMEQAVPEKKDEGEKREEFVEEISRPEEPVASVSEPQAVVLPEPQPEPEKGPEPQLETATDQVSQSAAELATVSASEREPQPLPQPEPAAAEPAPEPQQASEPQRELPSPESQRLSGPQPGLPSEPETTEPGQPVAETITTGPAVPQETVEQGEGPAVSTERMKPAETEVIGSRESPSAREAEVAPSSEKEQSKSATEKDEQKQTETAEPVIKTHVPVTSRPSYEYPETVSSENPPSPLSFPPRGEGRGEGFSSSFASRRLKDVSLQKRKNWLVYAGMAAVVIAVLYLSGIFEKPGVKVAEKEKHAETMVTEKPVPAEKPAAKKQVTSAQQKPLTIVVPPNVPIESDVYIVKKGDTLWAISKRFTGDPFNYPQVAADNNIKNPDLIFPDQKILLKHP